IRPTETAMLAHCQSERRFVGFGWVERCGCWLIGCPLIRAVARAGDPAEMVHQLAGCTTRKRIGLVENSPPMFKVATRRHALSDQAGCRAGSLYCSTANYVLIAGGGMKRISVFGLVLLVCWWSALQLSAQTATPTPPPRLDPLAATPSNIRAAVPT